MFMKCMHSVIKLRKLRKRWNDIAQTPKAVVHCDEKKRKLCYG